MTQGQPMRVDNSSTLTYNGWLPSTTAVYPSFTSGTIGATWLFVLGRQLGIRGKMMDTFWGNLQTGSALTANILDAISFSFDTTARDNAVASPSTALGGTPSVGGTNLSLISSTADGAAAVFYYRGVPYPNSTNLQERMLVVDLWIRYYPNQGWAFTEILVSAANNNPSTLSTTVVGSVPANFSLSINGASDAISYFISPTSNATNSIGLLPNLPNTSDILLPAGTTMGWGQGRAFTGVIFWNNRISSTDRDSIRAYMSGRVAVVGDSWDLNLGPLGKVPVPGNNFSATIWFNQNFPDALSSMWRWAPAFAIGPAAFAGQTGDQEDEGYGTKGTAIWYSGNGNPIGALGVNVLYWASLAMSRRPIHFKEADGSQLSITSHPNLFCWTTGTPWTSTIFSGGVFIPSGTSTDYLDKNFQVGRQYFDDVSFTNVTYGWSGPDLEHYFYHNLFCAYQLTGSQALQYLIEAVSRHFIYAVIADPTTATNFGVGRTAARAFGWLGIFATEAWLCVENRTVAAAVRQRYIDYANNIYIPGARLINSGDTMWDLIAEREPLYSCNLSMPGFDPSNETTWIQTATFHWIAMAYQYIFGAGGVQIAGEIFNNNTLKNFAYSGSKEMVERFYQPNINTPNSPFQWVTWDYFAINPTGGSQPEFYQPGNGYVEGRGAHHAGYYDFAWAPVGVWALLRNEPTHPKANAVWAYFNNIALNGNDTLHWWPPLDTVINTGIYLPNPPAAPSNLTGVSNQLNAIALSWVDNATSEEYYSVERADSTSTPLAWNQIFTGAPNTISYNNTGLASGQIWSYRVAAISGAYRAYSNTISLLVAPIDPTPPGNLIGVADPVLPQVDLNWTDPSNGEYQFSIFYSDDQGQNWPNFGLLASGTTFYRDSTIGVGATRWYGGHSYLSGYYSTVPSNVVIVTAAQAIAPPENLVATANPTLLSIFLSWDDIATNETSYRVERSLDGINYQEIASIAANSISYTDTTNLQYNTTYYYRVRAAREDLPTTTYSAYSNSFAVTSTRGVPAAPTNFTGVSFDTRPFVHLTWTDNATNEQWYQVQRVGTLGDPWDSVGALPPDSTDFWDRDINAGQSLYYRVRAENLLAASDWSPIIYMTAGGIIAAPTALTGFPILGTTNITLKWKDNSTNETRFAIERTNLGGQSFIIANVPADTQIFTDTTTPAGSTWSYRVRAENNTEVSDWSNLVTVTADNPNGNQPPTPVTPLAPTNLTLLNYTNRPQVGLTWQDNSSNEDRFIIQRATVTGGDTADWFKIGQVDRNITSYLDTGVSTGQQWFYRVYAENSNGFNGYSNIAGVTTTVPPYSVRPNDFVRLARSPEDSGTPPSGYVLNQSLVYKYDQFGNALSPLDRYDLVPATTGDPFVLIPVTGSLGSESHVVQFARRGAAPFYWRATVDGFTGMPLLRFFGGLNTNELYIERIFATGISGAMTHNPTQRGSINYPGVSITTGSPINTISRTNLINPSPTIWESYSSSSTGSCVIEGATTPLILDSDGLVQGTTFNHGGDVIHPIAAWDHRQFTRLELIVNGQHNLHRVTEWSHLRDGWSNSISGAAITASTFLGGPKLVDLGYNKLEWYNLDNNTGINASAAWTGYNFTQSETWYCTPQYLAGLNATGSIIYNRIPGIVGNGQHAMVVLSNTTTNWSVALATKLYSGTNGLQRPNFITLAWETGTIGLTGNEISDGGPTISVLSQDSSRVPDWISLTYLFYAGHYTGALPTMRAALSGGLLDVLPSTGINPIVTTGTIWPPIGITPPPPISLTGIRPPSRFVGTISNTGVGVDLSWDDNYNGQYYYKIQRNLDLTLPWATIAVVPQVDGQSHTSYTDRAVDLSTTYYYKAAVSTQDGKELSDYSRPPISVTTISPIVSGLPNAPSNLRAVVPTNQSGVNLTWIDNSTNEDYFMVQKATDLTGAWTNLVVSGQVTGVFSSGINTTGEVAYTDHTALTGTIFYRVTAVNASGASPYSNIAFATMARHVAKHLRLTVTGIRYRYENNIPIGADIGLSYNYDSEPPTN